MVRGISQLFTDDKRISTTEQQTGTNQPPIPPGMANIQQMADQFLPVIENITGLSRREIFLQLMKTGLRGGSLETLINGFMGKQVEREAKFVRYVKTLAVWLPVAFLLGGLTIICLFAFAKIAFTMAGGF